MSAAACGKAVSPGPGTRGAAPGSGLGSTAPAVLWPRLGLSAGFVNFGAGNLDARSERVAPEPRLWPVNFVRAPQGHAGKFGVFEKFAGVPWDHQMVWAPKGPVAGFVTGYPIQKFCRSGRV